MDGWEGEACRAEKLYKNEFDPSEVTIVLVRDPAELARLEEKLREYVRISEVADSDEGGEDPRSLADWLSDQGFDAPCTYSRYWPFDQVPE